VLYATFVQPMPYPNADQLVIVWSKRKGERNRVSPADFLDWKQQTTVFQDLNAWTGGEVNLATAGQPEFVQFPVFTPGWLKMLGVPFLLGRDFLPEEAQEGKHRVVILTNVLWQRMGADREILGRQIRLNGETFTVVGVLGPRVTDRQLHRSRFAVS
jgi:putative ABC transport system permease protein